MTLTLDLTKKIELSLEKAGIVNVPRLEVRLAVDESGSMQDEYRDGLVDAIIDRFIVAAMKFDDNQSLDVAFFNDSIREAPSALAEDVGSYIARKFPRRQWGGTSYAPIVTMFETRQAEPVVTKGLFGLGGGSKQADGTSKYRGYVAVITDGDNMDKATFERAMDRTSGDTYFEFIAIGTDIHPRYLTEIANRYSNVGFTHIKSPKTIGDQEFYDALINDKLVAWLG